MAIFQSSEDVNDNYTLRMAASNGHLTVVDRLLQIPRVDVTANDNEAIREAAGNDYIEIVQLLCNHFMLKQIPEFYTELRATEAAYSTSSPNIMSNLLLCQSHLLRAQMNYYTHKWAEFLQLLVKIPNSQAIACKHV